MYIGIPFLAYDVNVKGNLYACGLPALTAVAGLAAGIEHKMAGEIELDGEIHVSISLLLSKVSLNAGTNADIIYQKGGVSKHGELKNAPLNDTKTAYMKGFMIIHIECDDPDDEGELWSYANSFNFRKMMRQMRLAGGMLQLRKTAFVVENDFTTCIKQTLGREITRPVFVLEDATHMIDDLKQPEEDRLDCLLRLVSSKRTAKNTDSDDAQTNSTPSQMPDKNEEAVSIEDESEYHGYMVPIAKGFVAIEPAVARKNVRLPDTLHAYAEPVLGLCRLRTVRSLMCALALEENDLRVLFRYPKTSLEAGGAVVDAFPVM